MHIRDGFRFRQSTIFVAVLFVIVSVFVGLFFSVDVTYGQVVQENTANTDLYQIEEVGDQLNLGRNNLMTIIKNVINVLLTLLGILVVIIFLYAGYLIMTSGGEEEKISKGRKMMINATVGLVIILASFAIVQFIFSLFDSGDTGGGIGGSGSPIIDSFAGAGSLGTIIKYHYPENNQKGVYRNTAIAVTFKVPIDPKTVILNTNNTCWPKDGTVTPVSCSDTAKADTNRPYLGDCLSPEDLVGTGETFSLVKHCDALNQETVQLFRTDSSEYFDNQQFVSTTAQTTYDASGRAYTFVFKPYNYLGSDSVEVPYEVRLLNGVKDGNVAKAGFFQKDVNSDAVTPITFSIANGAYRWVFETSTELDNKPPTVTFVYPKNNTTSTKDVIVSVLFSEAMNPITLEGIINQSQLNNNSPQTTQKNIVFGYGDPLSAQNNPFPAGEWILSNAYKSAEFFPTEPCGINSCGQQKYCLQIVRNTEADKKDDVEYARGLVLGLRTAAILPGGMPFEAVPMTGITDMAGNALDGNANGERNTKPAPTAIETLTPNECASSAADAPLVDNYCWAFTIKNDTDREPPYIRAVTPKIDEENVDEAYVGDNAVSTLSFSKLMLIKSFDDLKIEEYFSDASAKKDSDGFLLDSNDKHVLNKDGEKIPFTWFTSSTAYGLGYQTKAEVSTSTGSETHTAILEPTSPYGRGIGLDIFYFTSATSTIKDNFQNCMYPGRGPKPGSVNECRYSDEGGSSNCVPVEKTMDVSSGADTGCGYGDGTETGMQQADLTACRGLLINSINNP